MSHQPGRSPQRQPSPSPKRQASPSPNRNPQKPSSQQEKEISFLFDRLGEPVFYPKGDEYAVFDVPESYIDEEYRPAKETFQNRNKDELGEHIPIVRITPPDIRPLLALKRTDNFSIFIPFHRNLASILIKMMMGMRNYEEFKALCVYVRGKVNPYLYIYSASVAILHRQDTKNEAVPPLVEFMPDKFVESGVLKRSKEISNILDPDKRVPVEIPRDYSASDTDPEHKVAYFREDLGINLHHWHWHLVYPFGGDISVVRKDRRGELFYYMHQQIMARYNFERLCNGLPRTERLANFRDPLPQGYFSKLDSLVSSRVWPPRHDNAVLADINRETDQLKFDLSDLERWRDRIFEAIAQGAVLDPNGKRIELDEARGIDILGNVIESSILTPNVNYYGNFHNFGHIAIALCHDPLAKHLETFGVMGDPATAMRDPLFYRWHAYMDFIFQQYKNTLPTYNEQTLSYPGIRIAGFEVVTKGKNKNELFTFWEQNDVNLSRGIDFTPRGNVFARFSHLQHQPFTYRLLLENTTGQNKAGTVRIFIAPKFDERGIPWLYVNHKNMFVELDKFPLSLQQSKTTVERKSSESSVTIPFETTFRNLNRGRPKGGSNLQEFNFCGCGWPEHMLIPKGSAEGFPCVVFAMFSNIDGDRVAQQGSQGKQCDDAASYCGIRDQLYPDKRSMGFPFDRLPRTNVDTLRQFLTPNMAVTDVKIFHQDRVEARKRNVE